MQRWGALLLVVCIGCGGDDGGSATGDDGTPGSDAGSGSNPGSDGGGSSGEPAELAGIVAAHNAVRAMVTTTPALPDLVWDQDLADIAAAWIAQCHDTDQPIGLVDHNPAHTNGYNGQPFGENAYGSSGGATGPAAVQSWAAEKTDYTYSSNTCGAGKICGHYTQLVWRATTKVGCAIHTCPGLTYGSTIFCDYAPAGNFGGQKPY
ncbi:MAG TPA: CAP domain-containing protein [Kofleriaceae bacterium]|jgi:hypothetical protein